MARAKVGRSCAWLRHERAGGGRQWLGGGGGGGGGLAGAFFDVAVDVPVVQIVTWVSSSWTRW